MLVIHPFSPAARLILVGVALISWIGSPLFAAAPTVTYTQIQNIFATHCYSCHGPAKQKSDYRLDLKSSALHGGSIGSAIVPGNVSASKLLAYVSNTDPDVRMPPKGQLLSAEEVALLHAWIEQGATWPDTIETTTRPVHWSLLPIRRPALPEVHDSAWIRNDIDRFILAQLEKNHLHPAPPADKRTLLRRITFDLTGLPPTPEELQAFLADNSADAYEKVVDRLLNSPRYGERFARQWMDLIHWAETHGNDEDKPRPNAWPYRDYLIRSFNQDKPYALFVEEQLAGDVLFPDDPQATVATAFIAAGPWDQSSMMGIQDETLDKKNARYLDRDDMVMTTMSTFTSSTVHCARCHNHKFDPISQEDYYALQAVFAGVDRIDRPYDPDPLAHHQRQALLARKKHLQSNILPPSELLASSVQARVKAWENSLGSAAPQWKPLSITRIDSTAHSTLTEIYDGSILASGGRPDKDTYTITTTTELAKVTAIRLELLTDDSLPHHGPGRQDNGNLHLSEFALSADGSDVPLQNPTSDFDQQDWGIAKSLDKNPATAWGIYPEIGKAHEGIFELKTALSSTHLTFSLAQLHGTGHVIGRFRLSVTDAPLPIRVRPTPQPILAILSVPSDRRTNAQRAALARHVLLSDIEQQINQLPPPKMVYAVATDFDPKGNFKPAKGPRAVEMLRRGDIRQPIAPAAPGALSCLSLPSRFTLPSVNDEGARRAALAHWITDRDNPLTWRSIVNRLWQSHFSRGIAATPNDFGTMGSPPSHPELLDYLAITLRDQTHSLKALHRMIVTSATYRQSSSPLPTQDSALRTQDFFSPFPRQRLDAEQIHDAVLSITGRLDLTMGGPSVKQFIESKGVHETPNIDYTAFDPDAPGANRRSVYRFIFRTLPDPFMQTLDCPDASQLTAKRESSVTPLQALAMLNDPFIIRQSQHLAERLEKEAAGATEQIERLYQLVLCRGPTKSELQAMETYSQKHGLANACRMLLNTNEFVFIE